MKLLLIALMAILISACASNSNRTPASTEIDNGITADSYGVNR